MGLISGNSAVLPQSLSVSANQLVIEKSLREPFDLVVPRWENGPCLFFNIEGYSYDYDASKHLLRYLARKAGRFRRAGDQTGVPRKPG